MDSTISVSVIITAGGLSQRFGSNKLLEKLGDKTVVETTILKFLDYAQEIVIPATDEIKNFLIKSTIIDTKKIKFALPGKTRQESVYNALLVCSNPKNVLIHDGARPFIDSETIKKTLLQLKTHKAVVVGIFAVDTIKEVVNNKVIKTLDRKKIFQTQTPQGFDYQFIKKIHELYKNNQTFTDDSSLVEFFGENVVVVEGTRKNIKITTKEDLS